MLKRLPPIAFALVDAIIVVSCLAAAIWLRDTILPALRISPAFEPVRDYWSLWPALVLVMVTRAVVGLYPGYGRTAPEELRLQTLTTVVVLAFVFAGAALFRFSATYSRFVLASTATLLLIALPLARSLAKHLMSRFEFYGQNVAILGRGPRTGVIRDLLAKQRALGLRPLPSPTHDRKADICLLVPDQLSAPLPDVLYELSRRYPRVLLAPDLLDVASVWVTARDISGHLALELRNNLLLPANRAFKRVLDITLSLVTGILASPIMIVIALLVASTSAGPVFVRQRRIGQGGRRFWIYKFRTMHRDASSQLQAMLDADPKARAEWEKTRKLKNDPRVTAVGRVLRAWSLDELPQLWSVLLGDMSLVGPRPIVQDELELYRDRSKLYLAVRPGLTGLMQVSGRNDIPYEERVRLDAYYVRNWSVWMDITILARTILAVVRRDGAY